MNILRLSTLSLTVAIAVFALGYANPALAGKPGANCDETKGDVHPSCKDESGDPGGNNGPTWSVEVITATMDVRGVNTTTGLVECLGTTEGENDLNVSFPRCTNVHVTARGVPLYLFAIAVRTNKSDAQLFFTDDLVPLSGPVPNDSVYVSSRVSWTLDDPPNPTFQLDAGGELDVDLQKAHRPNKGMPMGPIAVGDIVYTPN